MKKSVQGVHPGQSVDRDLIDCTPLTGALEAAQALAELEELPRLLEKLTVTMAETAGALRSYVLLPGGDRWQVVASGVVGSDEPEKAASTRLSEDLPWPVFDHVSHTRAPLLMCQGKRIGEWGNDVEPFDPRVKSFLCLPMQLRGELVGVVYLESRLDQDACAPGRLQLLNILATQAAICVKNARLVTSLEQVEQSARASERRFRHLFQNAPVCIFEVDLAATPAVILSANRRAEAVYGWTADDFTSMEAGKLVPSSRLPGIQRLVEQVRAGQTVSLETENQRRDGSVFPVRIIATPETGPHADHMVVAVEDITAEHQSRSEAEAIDQERLRIAQEIHDGVAQDMAALRLRASLWVDLAEIDPGKMRAELGDLQDILDNSISQLRRVICALRPVALDEVGLFRALRRLAGDFENQHRIHVNVQIAGSEEYLPTGLELPLFRIAQEALNNVGKHARANVVTVTLDIPETGAISLLVRDNGSGFDQSHLEGATRRGHLGLRQMEERARGAGGKLDVVSRPGEGTEVRVVFPIR